MSLARAIRAAVGGRKTNKRLEEDRPEDLEDDLQPEEVEDDPDNPDASEDEDTQPDADEDEPVAEEEEMSGDYARGRKAERKRMSAILGSSKADGNPTLAAHLAFNTSMSAKQAVATLAASGASTAAPSLSARMQGRVPALGSGGAKRTAGTADERLVAHAKARNQRR